MHTNQILSKIKRAQSRSEIDALLAEAEMFKNLSEDTHRRHRRFADKRLKELEDSAGK